MTRTKNSIRNIKFTLLASVVTILVGLIARRVFVDILGTDYLGVNGLLTSIVSMLALAELGLGAAIYYHLYKPIADGDIAKVKSLVNFYKKGYRLVAVAVLFLGMLLLPFLSAIVGNVNIPENIYFIYLLFLLDIVFSYLLTYKRAVLYVDQKNHIISTVHLGYFIALNAFQIAVLITTGNFYYYLILKIVMRLVENIVLTHVTNKKYTYLKDKSVVALDSVTKSEIYKSIRGQSYHKIGSYVVFGTDNVVISIFLGIATVGLYSNYYLIISAISLVVSQVFTALTASVGNLLATSKNSKSFEVYKKVHFGNFWLSCFAVTSLLVLMDRFITLWIGGRYVLPFGVLVVLSVNLYMSLIRTTIENFKESAGIFHQDRFVPIVESIANIVFSITLLHFFGLAGVFLGTVCSTLIQYLFSYPKFVCKPLFNQSYSSYYRDFLKNILIALFVAAVTFAVSRSIAVEGNITTFIVNVLLCLTIPNIILFVIFRKSVEFNYYKLLANNAIKSAIKRLR